MPADKFGIDMGEINSQRAAHAQRSRNALTFQQGQEDRTSARLNARMGQEHRRNILTNTGAGRRLAMQEYIVHSPKEAKAFRTTLNEMDDRQREETKRQIDQMGRVLTAIMNNPESERFYDEVKEGLNFPDDYDENWVKFQAARMYSFDKQMEQNAENPEIVKGLGIYKGGKKIGEAPEEAPAGGRPTDMMIRVESRMAGDENNPPMSRYDAIAMEKDVTTDMTESGQVRTIDRAARTATDVPVTGPGTEAPIPKPPEGQTLWDLSSDATGFLDVVKAGISRPTGGVGGLPYADRQIHAQDRIKLVTETFINTLIDDQRFSLGLRQIASDALNFKVGAFNSDASLQSAMFAANQTLIGVLNQSIRDARDESLPPDHKEAQKRNASVIANFLAELGAPQAISADMLTLETIPDFAIQDIERFIVTATDTLIKSLPDDVYQALMDKANAP